MNIFNGIIGLAKNIFGVDQASQQLVTDRLKICNQCDLKCGARCAMCGCYIFLKAKLESEECPIEKW
jgi:hypothetical protein